MENIRAVQETIPVPHASLQLQHFWDIVTVNCDRKQNNDYRNTNTRAKKMQSHVELQTIVQTMS